jgi:hypothetical protein
MPRSRKRRRRKRGGGKTYRKEDYEDGNGMLTKIWGPSLWHYLHVMSFNYPVNPSKEDKDNYRKFLCSLRHVLPCGKCRKNLRKNFKKLPPKRGVFKNRETFSRYIYNLHELINKMLKKKSGLSYDEVRERYEHFRARCSSVQVGRQMTLKKYKKSKNKTRKENKEEGCVVPLHGKKAKCVIKIVPQETKCQTFQMDKKCEKKRL